MLKKPTKYIIPHKILLSLSFLLCLSVQSLFAVHDYINALYLTTYFYGAQRCGSTSSWCHAACHVKDGQTVSLDLTGGWHDCGDHVTFGQTAPYSAGVLLEGYLLKTASYKDTYSPANSAAPSNGIPDILDEVKIMTDLLIKCTTGGRFYYQKGNGDYDHKHMCEPAYFSTTYNVVDGGEKDGGRPMSYVTSGGSNVCGDAAAALALMAIAYAPYDSTYATTCFTKAKEVYAIGDTSRGTVSGGSYYGAANYVDDMAWGGATIYRASVARGAPESTYLTKAVADIAGGQSAGSWPLCYDHTEFLAHYNIYKINGTASDLTWMTSDVTYYKSKMVTCGIGSYAWVTGWGSLRYASNMAFATALLHSISAVAADYTFVKNNVDFILGTHGDITGSPGCQTGRSFVIGYTNPDYPAAGSVQHPHHRAAFGKTSSADTDWVTENTTPGSIAYLYQLKGALVGGPQSSCSNYNDRIDDYVANEVGIDYNAGLVGAIAYVISMVNPSTPTYTPTPNLSWTKTRTATITPTWTQSPIPPPTNKLNLEIMTNSSYDSCTNQTFSFYYKITNWETSVVSTSNIYIALWLEATDAITGVVDSAAAYDSSGGGYTSITAAIAEGAGAGCTGASKSARITMSTVNIPANGGYVILQGRVIRGSYLSPFDSTCDDYTQLRSTWSSYTNNTTQTLWQGTNLVCEYISASTQDTSTGLHPCTGANGCGAAGTNTASPTRTRTPTPTFTRTNTQVVSTSTYTRTRTPTYTRTRTATPTFTRTGTPVITSTYTRTRTRTITPTFTRTGTPVITSTYTRTRTGTPTFTRTGTPVNTSTFSRTPTGTYTRTWTPTGTSTRTNTQVVNTSTYTRTATGTFTRTLTGTPTFTRTNTMPANTSTFTRTASASASVSPTFTYTRTPTGTFTRTQSATASVSPTPTYTRTRTGTYTRTRTATPTYTNTVPPATSTFTRTQTGTYTRTQTGTYTRTRTATPSASATASVSQTPTYTITRTASGSPTFTNTRTPTYTRTSTNTPVNTSTFTRTRTGTPTYTRTATSTFTRTQTGSATASGSPTFTNTRTPTFTATSTNTPSPTVSDTWTPGYGTYTNTPTITQTWTNSASPTRTHTPTASPSRTMTGTFTRTETPTHTRTATPTHTRTYTNTPVDTPTFTSTRTGTPTYTSTVPTATPTYTRTSTPTFTRTDTPTYTRTRTGTPTYTITVTPTFTRTPSPTFTLTRTNTPSPTVSDTWTPGYGTQTFTPTITRTWTYSATPTRTPSATATSTSTSTSSVQPTSTSSVQPTSTSSVQPTSTSSVQPTSTSSVQPTSTSSVQPTSTSSVQPTSTSSVSPMNTYTRTPTNSPVNTSTDTPVDTVTSTPVPPTETWTPGYGTQTNTPIVPTVTNTPVNTQTSTPANTYTNTPTSTVTNTVLQSATYTRTVTFTATPTFTVTVTNTFTFTFTRTFTVTVTSTFTVTPTPTFTRTGTPTFTRTASPTSQSTATFTLTVTPTSTKTPEVQAITGLVPYPNPVNPSVAAYLYIGFTAARLDSDSIALKIYTSGQRLVRTIRYEGPEAQNIMTASRFRCDAAELSGLSNGTYYYVLTAEKAGDIARSKVDKIVILK